MKNTEKNAIIRDDSPNISDNPIAAALVKVGKEGIEPGDESVLNAYFSDDFVFHSPDGDMTFTELKAFWTVWRNALKDFTITREQIIVKDNFVGARNTFSGIFENELTKSAVGSIQPNGQPVRIEVINTFRYNEEGLLAEEWVQYDNISMLKQFGVDILSNR